jgi:hypothetical protein
VARLTGWRPSSARAGMRKVYREVVFHQIRICAGTSLSFLFV